MMASRLASGPTELSRHVGPGGKDGGLLAWEIIK